MGKYLRLHKLLQSRRKLESRFSFLSFLLCFTGTVLLEAKEGVHKSVNPKAQYRANVADRLLLSGGNNIYRGQGWMMNLLGLGMYS